MNLSEISCVQWFEGTEKHRCGYCKKENTSISNGMWAENLTVQDYQNLIDRGWRRSGKYCYKPVMDETCCPQYPIKCDISAFSLSKSQKKIIKKFNKYLADDLLDKRDTTSEAHFTDGYECSEIYVRDQPNLKNISMCLTSENIKEPESSGTGESSIIKNESNRKEKNECDKLESQCTSSSKAVNLDIPYSKGKGPDLNKPPCKKAKLIRLERKKEKLLKSGLTLEKNNPQSEKSIEQFLNDICSDPKNKLQIRLISSSRPPFDWKDIEEVEYQLYKRYQMVVHNDPLEKLSIASFNRFLVKSPLKPENFPDGIDGPGYGSFHQQYWLNDKLVAVGVIDILPKCVSSVYFFYDPDYRNLTLGTYGSLREIQFTRFLHKKIPEICNYYMGFYIHSCPKMRYKGKLSPSFLLCPETYFWVPIEKCIEKLDNEKYSRLNEDIDAIDREVPSQEDINKIQIIYNNKIMYFKNFKKYYPQPNLFKHIGHLIGKQCCKSIIFWEN